MGKKLSEMYDEAKKIGGFSAQMRMAILTMIPSVKAMEAVDSPENVSKFQSALNTIKKEAGK
jgi:hypothetical protein